jgi:hypothetical protein
MTGIESFRIYNKLKGTTICDTEQFKVHTLFYGAAKNIIFNSFNNFRTVYNISI